jgi:hypothetical protein
MPRIAGLACALALANAPAMSITAGSAIEPKRSENMTVFFLRIRARRGQHVAAVATARKLAVLLWHLLSKRESYLWARPALHARKVRDLRLKAGHRAARGGCPPPPRLHFEGARAGSFSNTS